MSSEKQIGTKQGEKRAAEQQTTRALALEGKALLVRVLSAGGDDGGSVGGWVPSEKNTGKCKKGKKGKQGEKGKKCKKYLALSPTPSKCGLPRRAAQRASIGRHFSGK